MQRNHYFDFLRGIAIMMVVAIHTFNATETDVPHHVVDVYCLVRQLLNCAVPIFLAISGYFLCSKNLATWDKRKAFWVKQMPKVYIPTMIASLPYLIISLMHGMNAFVAVIYMIVCGYSIYYFIALILQYYALLPVLQKVTSGGVILSAAISMISVGGVTYVTKIMNPNLPLIAYAGSFPVWLVFYAMGCYLRKVKRDYSLYLPVIMVLLSIVISYAETYYWNTFYDGGFGIKCSAYVYSMAVIMVLFSIRVEQAYKRNIVTRSIEYIGRISFAIYLYHLFVVMCFDRFHVTEMPWIIRWMVCIATTTVVVTLARRIFPKKYYWVYGG